MEKLQRMPSGIYWRGLWEWGIWGQEQSQDTYHRTANGEDGRRGHVERDENGEPLEDDLREGWHAGLPPDPEDFLERTSFSLTRREAEYLRERILTNKPGTLLAFLVGRDDPPERTSFPWELDLTGVPQDLSEQLHHARNFSEVMHGASLLYNLMVAEAARKEENVLKYEQELSKWAAGIEVRLDDLSAWNLDPLWDLISSVRKTGASMATRLFVDTWKRMVCTSSGPRSVVSDQRVHDLIRERERRLKRGWARLSSPRALEIWGGESSAGQLDYRWTYANRILSDIFEGLEKDRVA